MAAPIPGVVDMIDQSLLSRNLAAGYQMGLAGRQQRMAEEQMAEQQKRQKVEDAYRAADMLTKMDLPEETSTKLFQAHVIPALNASYGLNIPTDTQWQPTMKKYLKQIATIAQSADIADADKPAMIKAAVMEAAAKGKDISSAAKPLLADIDERLETEAQYGMLPRTPSITQGMVTAPPSGSYEPTPQTMGLAERYKMPEQNVAAQPLADVAPISKEMLSRLPASMRQKIVEAQRPDLFGGGKKPVAYMDDMGQPQFLPEGQMPPKGWVPYDKPTKPEKGTQLAQLIEEQRQYPKGSPEWKAYQQRISKEMTHQPATTVNVSTEKKFGEKVAEREAEQLYKEKDDAVDAAGNMVTINNAVKLLDSGIYSGRFANLKLEFGKALHAAGIGYADDAVANTEAYVANQASMVGSIIKLFGAGTGLSDADREYAEKAAAGKITLNEASMRKILGMASKVSKYRLDKYNKKARKLQDKFKDSIPYSLEVEMPEAPSGASDVKSMSDEDLLRELGK